MNKVELNHSSTTQIFIVPWQCQPPPPSPPLTDRHTPSIICTTPGYPELKALAKVWGLIFFRNFERKI